VAKVPKFPHPTKRKKRKKKLLHFSSENLSFFNNEKDWGFCFFFFLVQIQLKLLKYFWKNP
jgi:hypothetical protein